MRGGWGRFYERFQLGDYSGFFLDAVELDRGFLRRFPESGSNKNLFWDIVQQNNINSLNELRDYLNNMIEGGTGTLLNISPTVDNPDRKEGYADTFSVGVQRELSPGLALVVDFIRTQNRDIKQTLDLNPYSRSMGGRPNISILNGEQLSGMSSITSWWNGGETNYTALQFSLQRRFRDTPVGKLSGRVSYTYATQKGNSDAGFGTSRFQYRTETGYNFDTGQWIGEDPDPNIDDPQNVDRPSSWHRDHNFVTSWSWLIPRTGWRASSGLQFSGVLRYMLGSRYTVDLRAFMDNNQRGVAGPGTYSSNIPSDIGLTTDFDGAINTAEMPDFLRLDMTFRYGIPIATRYQLMFLFDVFNISNRVNFSNVGSTYTTDGTFLIPSQTFAPTELQFGFRFTF